MSLPVPAGTLVSTDAENGVCTGQLDGDLQVTPDGAAVFRLPLWVPPGRNGLQPDLALQYDSRSGNGLLGVGWTLTGIPTITRCQRRFSEEDGPVRAIQFDATDHFALGGQRLVAVNGINGADGTEYRTQRDSFARITIKGTDALGPVTFELRAKDGRILTFGAEPARPREQVVVTGDDASDVKTVHSHVRHAWSLQRVEDRSGNWIAIDYGVVVGAPGSALRGEYLPTRIRYTGFGDERSELVTTKEVHFAYGSHPEPTIGYVSGVEIRRAARLERIEMWGPDQEGTELLRLYEITYKVSPTSNRSLVHTIRECDGWPTTPAEEGGMEREAPRRARRGVCKRPVVIEWERGSADFLEPSPSGLLDPDPMSRVLSGRLIPADVNGDGRDDLVCMIPVSAVSASTALRHFYGFLISDGIGLGPLQITDRGAPAWMRAVPIDFDMDGRVELLLYKEGSFSEKARTALTRVSTDSASNVIGFEELFTFPANDYLTVDFDGNRLANVVLTRDGGSYWRNVGGTYFDGPQALPLPPAGDPRITGRHLVLDLDGDGALEVLCPRFKERPSGGIILTPAELVVVATAPPYALHYEAVSPNKPTVDVDLVSDDQHIFVDLNGDGLVDAITFDAGADDDAPAVTVLINTGAGFVAKTTQSFPGIDFRTAQVRVINYAGDGSQQLLVRPFSGLQDDAMRILRWNGSQLVDRPLNVRTLWTDGEKFRVIEVLDVDGDGLDDFAMLNQLRPSGPTIIGEGPNAAEGGAAGVPPRSASGPPTEPPSLHVYRRLGKKADMMVGIRSALGCRRGISYEPLSNPAVYQDTQATSYPLYATRSKRWVVSRTTISDGVGGTNAMQYRYEDGRTDLLGEGFLGFRVQQITDTRTGAVTRSTFDFVRANGVYPLAGMPTDVVTRWTLTGGVQREHTVHTDHAIRSDATGHALFAFAQTITEAETETGVSGVETIRESVTRQDFDQYGNQTLRDTSWPDGRREVHGVRYAPRPVDWLIALRDIEWFESTTPAQSRRRRTAYVYDGAGRLVQEIIEPGPKVMGQYQPLPPQADGAQTLFVSYSYYPEGTLRRIESSPSPVSGSGRAVDFAYEPAERAWLASTVNALGHTTEWAYHPGVGVLAVFKDSNGHRTTNQYDRFGRLKRIAPPNKDDVTVTYVRQVALPAGVPGVDVSQCEVRQFASGPLLETVFDIRERRILERSHVRADGQAVLRRTRYDSMGQVSAMALPHFETDAPRWSTVAYDTLGRPTARHRAVGSRETFDYRGRTIVWTNARHRSTTYEFDARDRLIRQRETSGVGATVATSYDYGPFGDMQLVIDAAGMPTRIEYDRFGRTRRVLDRNANEERLRYNAFGELDTIVRVSRTISYQYDAIGRVARIDAPEGANLYTWDTSTNGIGRLASSVSTDGVRLEYHYDPIGRPRSRRWSIHGDQFDLAVVYDTVGRLLGLSYPHTAGPPVRLAYRYGAFGELLSVSDGASGAAYWTRSSSDASGRFTRDVLGNGVTTEWQESPSHPGLLRRIRDSDAAGTDVQNILYDFDAQLNVTRRRDQVLNTREASSYDSLDRLVEWDCASSAGSLKMSWSYDDVGNIVSSARWASPGGSTNMALGYGAGGAGPHAVSSAGTAHYTYDQFGNQRHAPGRSIDYTSFGLPSALTIGGSATSFEYDGEMRRVFSSSGAGHAAVSLAGLYERRSRDGSQRFLIRVNGRAVAQIERHPAMPDTVSYLHTDHLGSLQAITDATGAVTGTFRYAPFGVPIDPAMPGGPAPGIASGVIIGYAGHAASLPSGLIDMRGRWYDPELARFLSPDPVRVFPSPGQRQNAYSYALDNPLAWIDPTGFAPEQAADEDPFWNELMNYRRQFGIDSWNELDSAVDWAHDQMSAAAAVPNDTGFAGGGIADFGVQAGLGATVNALPRVSGWSTVFTSGGSSYPDFTDPDEPQAAARRWTPEVRARASREAPAKPVYDYHGANMGGHIQNLRNLLRQYGIATRLAGNVEIQTSVPYEQVIAVLKGLYYYGALAANPIDHPGGKEFRNWASPGFHFKVVYPDGGGGPTRITDLHIDQNNPLLEGKIFDHARDFVNEKR